MEETKKKRNVHIWGTKDQTSIEGNIHNDSFASLASTLNTELRRVIPISCQSSPSIIEDIKKSIDPKLSSTKTNSSWHTPYLEYIIQGIFLTNKEEVKKITTKSKKYTII